jgi:hypothetical protein
VLIGRVTLGAFALVYLVNWIDVLFISRPKKHLDVNISRLAFANDVSLEVYPRYIFPYQKFPLADGINLGVNLKF